MSDMLEEAQLRKFSEAQLRKFSPAQLRKFSPAQLRKVSPAQLRNILHKALEQPARRPRLLFGLTLFVAWRRYPEHVISSPEEWGPRWLAELVAKAFSTLMELVGARLVRHHAALPFEPPGHRAYGGAPLERGSWKPQIIAFSS